MKTIITIFLFFVCALTFGQAIDTFVAKSDKEYPLHWNLAPPTTNMVNTIATGSMVQWVYYTLRDSVRLVNSNLATSKTDIAKLKTDLTTAKSDITKLKADIALLKAAGSTTVLKDSITALRKEINQLKAETIEIQFDGFVKVDSTDGKVTLNVDPNLLQFKGSFTTAERDAAYAAGILREGHGIYNKTTGVLQVRNKTGWKNL